MKKAFILRELKYDKSDVYNLIYLICGLTNVRKKVNFNMSVFMLVFIFKASILNATITIDSVNTVISTCTNNGTAEIFATSSPNPFLLYAIVAGPVTAPLQNSPLFTSLYPGNYTVRVYDINFDSLETQFVIGGNYQVPYFSLVTENPTCSGFSDGQILAPADTTKGLMPFTWEIISPNQIGPQSADLFTNLSANSYVVRLTDACGNYQSRTGILTNSGTGLAPAFGVFIPELNKIGCDTMALGCTFLLAKEKRDIPLTLSTTTSSGTIIKKLFPEVIDTFNYVPGLFRIRDTLAGLTYNDYLHVELSDTCGVTLYSYPDQVSPFDFDLYFTGITINCNILFSATLSLKYWPVYPYDFTVMMAPGSLTLIDLANGNMVDSMTCTTYCGLTIQPQVAGKLYLLTITDGCGEIFQKIIQWPTSGTPTVNTGIGYGCLDSTAAVYFSCQNFNSSLTLSILSGPSNIGSTKPHYSYSDTIIYPRIFTNMNPAGMSIKNFPAGNYQYMINDSCGNSFSGSLTIDPAAVSNLIYSWYIKNSCLSDNSLYFNVMDGTPMAAACVIKDDSTGNTLLLSIPPHFGTDSIISLGTGKYILEVYYGNYFGSGQVFNGSLSNGMVDCWVMIDTISIFPYQNTSFITNTTVFCNGTSYVELTVDSNKGVPPYKYEIINGPQTFPQQDSNFFQIQFFGNYVIRVQDACGNSYIQQISIDSAAFPPIIKSGVICTGNRIILSGVSSAYFTYQWQYPDGTLFTGDSLVIDPFSAADTGIYHLSKFVNINGCYDTLITSYYLALADSFLLTVSICQGDTLFVHNHAYTAPGFYVDSLPGINGCDSIIYTTLSVFPQVADTGFYSICSGDSVIVGDHIYQLPGIYLDSVINGNGCPGILFSIINFANPLNLVNQVICPGDSIFSGNHFYSTTGTYVDSLISAAGCDSIIQLNLTVSDYKTDTINLAVCNGEHVIIGNNTYSQSGIYSDTLSTNTCDSIVVLFLDVIPLIKNNIQREICIGDSLLMGNNYYHVSGIYSDTLNTAACDSIVILDLVVSPFKFSQVNLSFCEGDSIALNGIIYNQAGLYYDTLSTLSCDSIITISLNQIANPEVQIVLPSADFISGTVVQLNSISGQNMLYSWGDLATLNDYHVADPLATFDHSGWITLVVTDLNGCIGIDSAYIKVVSCGEDELFVPNVFTPNGDGFNDYFKIKAINAEMEKIQVFNRWGELVFESNSLDNSWNGKINGKIQYDTFFYTIQFKSCKQQEVKMIKGHVSLLR